MTSAGDRRAAYADGVIAAAAALMSDLEVLGVLADAEDARGGQDGDRLVCSTCQMRRFGYGALADRVEFAIDVSRQHGQEGGP